MDHASGSHVGGAKDRRLLLSVARGQRQGAKSAREIAVELPISRTEIADYLGLTIETVSRQIARLRERGTVSVGPGRSLVIHHPEVLEATVENASPSERMRVALRV